MPAKDDIYTRTMDVRFISFLLVFSLPTGSMCYCQHMHTPHTSDIICLDHTLAVCVSTTFLETKSDLLPTSSLFTFSLA